MERAGSSHSVNVVAYSEKQGKPLEAEAVVSLLQDADVVRMSLLLGQVVNWENVAHGEFLDKF